MEGRDSSNGQKNRWVQCPFNSQVRTAVSLSSTDQVSRASDSSQIPFKAISKGLRSYDEDDDGFFVDLLPPPRHPEDGLPLIIHFWKARIEKPDPDMVPGW